MRILFIYMYQIFNILHLMHQVKKTLELVNPHANVTKEIKTPQTVETGFRKNNPRGP